MARRVRGAITEFSSFIYRLVRRMTRADIATTLKKPTSRADPPSTGLSVALGLCASVTGVDRPSWYLLHLRGSNIRGSRAYRLSGRGTRSRS